MIKHVKLIRKHFKDVQQVKGVRKVQEFLQLLEKYQHLFPEVSLKLLEILFQGQPSPEMKFLLICIAIFFLQSSGRGKHMTVWALDSSLMLTSHLGDSGINHKPISKEMHGTSPSNCKPSSQLDLFIHNGIHLKQQFKANAMIYQLKLVLSNL